jgi:hypothetical protein
MTWIKFALWLCGLYTAYYGIVILWDYLRNGQVSNQQETHELSFAEHIAPVAVMAELTMADVGSAVYASGGVSLKSMFNLCREEAVEYIKQVSY